MNSRLPHGVVDLARFIAQSGEFDAIIDARSPAEFADDHLPGAISLPVLSDTERAQVGTLYTQVSPFEAKKLGAALVAKSIACHIEQHLLDKPKGWRPLVYCWRGGQRSGAFTHILREIGWNAHRLQDGYKAWRRHVITQLATLPAQLEFRVISGATGSGKSRLLEALAAKGAQVLHLEALAAHKGSTLGELPGQAQPSQRSFESGLHAVLTTFDRSRPVFVEAESRKIGEVQLPNELLAAIRCAPCICIEASVAARVEFLLRDYDYATTDTAWLLTRLDHLKGLQSNETLLRWRSLIEAKAFPLLVEELLVQHYDPLYRRSQARNFVALGTAWQIASDDLTPAGISVMAAEILPLAG
ncbi:MAG: tRNA 2-selenouridine(34) synthase MnmH [Rhodocyclales bacterium]|nr:tRNA 2-selenouridine(34) synthase MnmH [Rhodocyclales bacterium]